jgi:hypothetical protein
MPYERIKRAIGNTPQTVLRVENLETHSFTMQL